LIIQYNPIVIMDGTSVTIPILIPNGNTEKPAP
jgi:hypothetical protein